MIFPVYLHVGPLLLHPHPVMEAIAFLASFTLARRQGRDRHHPDSINPAQRLLVLTAALLGALLGAKGLVLVQHWSELQRQGLTWELLLPGKTIVGAMVGGWLMVEVTKKLLGIQVSTGDRFIFPLLVGQAIGRLGCFLTGLGDRTYGVATTLPWGVDFGDAVLRHPTQLYEIIFLVGLGAILYWRSRRGLAPGLLFKLYFFSYFAFRFGIDFLKPDPKLGLGLSAVQIVCAIAACSLVAPLLRARSSFKLL
jgi:phosphatidylglycerol---prolipoprotein diacylglyceryl transferase